MKIRRPGYFGAFSCIAGNCPDTCCADWVIDLDEETYRRYQAMPGALGDRIRAALDGAPGARTIRTVDGRCALLEPDGLCAIVKACGEEGLGQVCHLRPRFTKYYGKLREDALSLSCPEAARLALTAREKAVFEELETDEPVRPNVLDYSLFQAVFQTRTAAIRLAQDRMLPFSERLARVLALGQAAQRQLRRPDRLAAVLQAPPAPRPKRAALVPVLDALAALEMTSPALPELLRQACGAPCQADDEIQCEQLLVYELYRFLPDAAEDGQLLARIQLAAVTVLAARAIWRTDPQPGQTPARRAFLAHYLARELEHSDENLAVLYRAFRHRRAFAPRRLQALALESAALTAH